MGNKKLDISKSDVIWMTLENSGATSMLSQHAYRNKVKGEVFLGEGEGNTTLCNRFSAWDGMGGPQRIEEYMKDAESKSEGCCKVCEKVFNKLKEQQ